MTGRARRTLAPLRHRGFRLLAGGQLASNIGDGCYAVALPWYILASHGGALLLGTVLAAYGLPRTVTLAIGGHASDRWHPWTVMMVADTVRALAVAVLAVAVLSGPPNAAVLMPIAAVIGAGEGLFLPGSFSIIPSLLPRADLQGGNALAASGTQLAALVGPAIGGGLVVVAGPAPAFFADAATFAISAMALTGIMAGQRPVLAGHHEPAAPADEAGAAAANPEADRPREQPPPATLRHLMRSSRVLQVILLVTLAANLGVGGLGSVALPALAHGPFHISAAGYGGLVVAVGAGALLGTLRAGHTGQLRRPAVVASCAFLVEAVFIALVPYLGSPVAAGAALGAFGLLNGFANVLTVTAVQRWAPPEVLGRLMGMVLLASFGIFPISVALGGIVVRDFGPAPFFPATAIVLAAAVLAALSQRAWREFGADTASGTPKEEEPRATARA